MRQAFQKRVERKLDLKEKLQKSVIVFQAHTIHQIWFKIPKKYYLLIFSCQNFQIIPEKFQAIKFLYNLSR